MDNRIWPMPTPPYAEDEIEQHRAAMTRYIRYLVRDSGEAEDLTQEALLRAHQQRDTLHDPMALESWLYKIATHIGIDRLRQRARSLERHVDAAIEDLPTPDRTRPSPFAMVQQREMSDCVQRYVAGLSDAYKAVLLLHFSMHGHFHRVVSLQLPSL